ncbi:MAG TPA: MmgE/PrpD family protein [Candidatus Binatia bacterium]|jgi:2-methylcitrate dehydratase PrpD|nr:MmgE/PrpD family protein [Candidatus Binatia bacterium]
MSMTGDITDFVVSFNLKAAPAELLPRVREAFLDSFGVMLAGCREESAQIAARWVRDQGNNGNCTVFAQKGLRTKPSNAALANGVAAHTLDYDHFGHQSAVMVPCVLAAGENQSISGRELIEAYIVGVEVSTLLAKGMGQEVKALGFHPAGVCGSLGATAAAARILGLERGQIQVALGIAASLTSGLSQNFGTMVKPLHLGAAAKNGIMAAELAAAGFTANSEIFDQQGGFFSALTAADTHETLGRKFRFSEPGIAFKAYPCPYSSQRAVDAVIKIAERHNITPRDVAEITCAAAPNTFRVLIHHRPTTSLEAKFSLEYLLAAGLVLKTINEECFEIKHVNDPVMRDLVSKVRIVDASTKRETPGEGAVTVQVRTPAALYEETVSYAPGHPKNPLSWERLGAKYQTCARQAAIQEPVLSRSLEMLSRIDEIDDVRELLQLFAA